MTTENSTRSRTKHRREQVLEMVAEEMSANEIAETFGLSLSTVRRDLGALAKDSRIVRTIGGAVLARRSEMSWHDKIMVETAAKNQIAAKAVELIPDGSVVFLDAGTSVATLASRLAGNRTLTLITSGLSSAIELADGVATVIVLGGRLRRPNASLTGAMANYMLDMVHPQIAFIGCEALDPSRGLNCPDIEVAALKQRIMTQIKQSWILADHTKFDVKETFSYWAQFGNTTGLITDEGSATTYAECISTLEAKGHKVIVAQTSKRSYLDTAPSFSAASTSAARLVH